ncbi:heterokaryon incompatibility protein-domain-containing protein [Tricladium varicosporioides]|nr:heterokaryon incompatibility protein-domain-containing protein [Hymenoscyphus varicosporioides]
MDIQPLFKYAQSPLPSPATYIRLIELLPPREGGPENITGVSTRPIYGRIFSAPIASLPTFKALSYSWGTSPERVRIEISGRDGEYGGLFITPSLEIALQHLRHPSESTRVWIDQICINQDDNQEKGEQVSLMCEIYSNAEEVLVWLGPAANESDALMDLWQEIGQEISDWGLESYYTKERFSLLQEIVAEIDPSEEKTISFHQICRTSIEKLHVKLRAIAAWYKREWFSRVWIIQEFCLGARAVFVCGEKREATNPRDRIYGMLALANDKDKLKIIPDYENSTVEEIYTSTTRAIIEAGDLDMLRLVQFPKYQNRLPSWVPDWRGKIYPCFTTVIPNAIERPLFAPSGSTTPSLISTNDCNLLGVEGYLVDEIEEVGSPWFVSDSAVFDSVKCQSYLSQIKYMCLIAGTKDFDIYDDPQRKSEAFWRIPIGDVEDTMTKEICRATPSFFDGYKSNISLFEAFQTIRLASIEKEVDDIFGLSGEHREVATRYRGRMYAMRDKRPFMSKRGYVGMGPVTTSPGDMIVVLIGAEVPFVLRPRDGQFFLLGESYCDGIMDGEIVTRRTKQDFILV